MPAFSRFKRLLRSIGHLIFFYAKKFHLIPYRFISVVSGVFRMFVGNEDSNQGGSSNWTEHRPSNDNGLEHDEDSEDLICEYDSTWDEYDDNQSNRKKVKKTKHQRSPRRWLMSSWSMGRNSNAARDMQTYRHDYPTLVDPAPCQDFRNHPNLRFYRNEIPSRPDNMTIEEFHNNWWGDYKKLERVHSYIQWLFPLREEGMNYQAHTLTQAEIKAFVADEAAKERLRTSYELMLDFYGIKLVNDKTGEVERAQHWESRFDNLNWNTHNNLRITRILKCLGTLGFKHYQVPLVRFFLRETLVNRQLENVKSSVLDYFMFSVLDKAQRRKLIQEAFTMFEKTKRGTEKFLWCPKWVQEQFKKTDTSSRDSGTLLRRAGVAPSTSEGVKQCVKKPANSHAKTKVDTSEPEQGGEVSADNTKDVDEGSAGNADNSIHEMESENAPNGSSVSALANDEQGSQDETGNKTIQDDKSVKEQTNQEVMAAGCPIALEINKVETGSTENSPTKDDTATEGKPKSTAIVSDKEVQTNMQTEKTPVTVDDGEKGEIETQAEKSGEGSDSVVVGDTISTTL
ncbi:opioid growth factor receptor-like protein 1 [Engraulis encrasicolus]|uniref:opioid growth factor receptor-like protein 1 n=1 Tax=Engraulis encrasicolus TaxID=184585 RepID=UPI002FD0410F